MPTPEPDLTQEQKNIVKNHINDAMLLLAPVGTGKTRVLAERVVEAIDYNFAPNRILCLTFTNRAAKEMQARLLKHLGRNAVMVKTFHGLCAHILGLEARHLGLPAEFVIYDEADSRDIIKDVAGIKKDKDATGLLDDLATGSGCSFPSTRKMIGATQTRPADSSMILIRNVSLGSAGGQR